MGYPTSHNGEYLEVRGAGPHLGAPLRDSRPHDSRSTSTACPHGGAPEHYLVALAQVAQALQRTTSPRLVVRHVLRAMRHMTGAAVATCYAPRLGLLLHDAPPRHSPPALADLRAMLRAVARTSPRTGRRRHAAVPAGYVALPLAYGRTMLGVVALHVEGGAELLPQERQLLATAAGLCSLALAAARPTVGGDGCRATETEAARCRTEARAEERRRLARELHDEVGQTLTALATTLAVLQGDLRRDHLSPAQVAERVQGMQALVAQGTEELRRVLQGLQPGDLSREGGIVPAMQALAERILAPAGVQTVVCVSNPMGALPASVEAVLYRVAQEGMHNIVKHAAATRVLVTLQVRGQCVQLILEDNGRGIDTRVPTGAGTARTALTGGVGLRGIQERVDQLGGTFAIGPRPERGTRLVVTLPLVG